MFNFAAGCLKLALTVLVTLIFLSSCSKPKYGLKPPTDVDVFELAPVSLKVEVQNFKWGYNESGDGLTITGKVKNNTGRTQRPIFLYAMLFDETGLAVAMGESRVDPTELAAGGEGDFTLKAKTSRPKNSRQGAIRHLRLLTNARNE
jgi:hypothetical protein